MLVLYLMKNKDSHKMVEGVAGMKEEKGKAPGGAENGKRKDFKTWLREPVTLSRFDWLHINFYIIVLLLMWVFR